MPDKVMQSNLENNPVVDYRARLLEQLLKSTDDFCAACRSAKDPVKPIVGDEWSIQRIAQHVRDVNAQSYTLRVQRTLTEEVPVFPKFDAEQWAQQHTDADEPLEKILAEFQEGIYSMVDELKAQPGDAWSRLGRHEIQGYRTLQLWVERCLEHIREHRETITTRTGK